MHNITTVLFMAVFKTLLQVTEQSRVVPYDDMHHERKTFIQLISERKKENK